ncbi:MAG: hypothetical protein Tp178MES00d2C33159851_27 [Prokaryotic dsDNA virus sp.]|nr:MAG: hypothetical protein Tp178MES00d2C33159851_27 [Prokaryotic dsDNA virus sp.]|tara:strand:+ start:81088 stop:81459 length:372 start_codon:yes stop_codon:yes gene_type:complete
MSTIKQETIDNIEQSRIIMSSFEKYGNRTKISLTWHTEEYAFTVQARATITFNKHIRLTTWDKLCDLLKPSDFLTYMESKVNGESKQNEDQAKCKAVFKLVCNELAKRGDSVIVEQYVTHKKG